MAETLKSLKSKWCRFETQTGTNDIQNPMPEIGFNTAQKYARRAHKLDSMVEVR